jgi:hypothetical protein
MSYKNEREADGWFELLKSVAWLAFTIVIGLWLVSAWLTRMFVEHVLDPITDQAFSRNDGLLIIASSLAWGIIIPLVLFPQLVADVSATRPEEVWQVLVGTMLLGLAWGVSVGVKVLVDLWLEVLDRPEPAYQPEHLLGEPLPVLPSPPDSGQPSLPTREELEADLEEVSGREEVLQGASLG